MTDDLKDRLPDPGKAVERAEPRKPSVAEVVRRSIELQTEAFAAVMPSGVDSDRFGRLVLTAVKATPQLMECFGTQQGQTTVLLAAMQCAALGLEPNTATQDAWLLPRRNKGVMECELSIGYRGLLKLARRSGVVKSIRAEVVHDRDEFLWAYGLEADTLDHKPYDGDEDPGELTHAYAVVRFTNGGVQFVVLNKRAVEKRRAMSASWKGNGRAYSPWTQWTEEMWRKTAVRALVPYLELSTEDVRALELEEQPLAISSDGVIDVAPSAGALGAGAGDDEGEMTVPPSAASPEAGGEEDGVPPTPASNPGEEPPAGEQEPSLPAEPMTDQQNKALHALLQRKKDAKGDDRFPVLTEMVGRPITTTKELSFSEASSLIDALNELPDYQKGEPGA